jgi:PAS domain S-box-containing protein
MEVERVSVQFFDLEKVTITSENTYILSKAEYGSGVSIMRKDYPGYFSSLELNKIIDISDAEIDSRTSELSEKYLKLYGITSLLNVPIKLKGNIVGIVCHEHIGKKREWTYEEMVFANSIADSVSLTLETEEREKTENELKLLNESLEERVKFRTAELYANEEKFRAVVETANDAIISINIEGKIIFWNKAAEKLFDYSSTEVIGQPVTIIVPQQLKESHSKAFDNYLKTKVPHHIGKGAIELNGLKKGDIEFPIELSLATWKFNNEDFFTAIIHDMTEHKKMEQALKDMQEKRTEETKMEEAKVEAKI